MTITEAQKKIAATLQELRDDIGVSVNGLETEWVNGVLFRLELTVYTKVWEKKVQEDSPTSSHTSETNKS